MSRGPFLLFFLLAAVGCDLGTKRAPLDPEAAKAAVQLVERIEKNPSDGPARLELGDLYWKAGRVFEAADQYKFAMDLSPSEPRAYAGLSDAYEKLGFYQQSFDVLVRCAQTVARSEECVLRIGFALKSDGTKEALSQAAQAFGHFLSIAPNHPRAEEVKKAMADIAAKLGALPKTQTATPAEDADPTSRPDIPEHEAAKPGEPIGELNAFGAAIGRALDAVKRNDAKAAETALHEALAISPDDVGANAFLAETYLAQGKMDEAIKQADKAYALDPKDSQARWVFGLVYIRANKDMKKGVDAWRALVADDPDYAEKAGVTKTLQQVEGMMKKPGGK